jgi:hypothetical protein
MSSYILGLFTKASWNHIYKKNHLRPRKSYMNGDIFCYWGHQYDYPAMAKSLVTNFGPI